MRQIAKEMVSELAPEITKEVVLELVPSIAAQIYNEALKKLVGAMEYDIETILSVSLEDAGELIRSKKFSKVISDKIAKSLKANIKGMTIK